MKVRYQTKVISEQKSAPFSLSLSKCKSAKSEAILRRKSRYRSSEFCFFVKSFKRTKAGEHCSPPHYALISLRLRVLSHDSLRSLTPAGLRYGSVLLLYLLQGRSVCRQSLVVLCQADLSSPAFSLQVLHSVSLDFFPTRFCTCLLYTSDAADEL